MFVVLVLVALIVTVKVAALSQPTEFVKCAVCEPAPLKVKPFHEYGNCDGHNVRVFVLVVGNFTTTVIVVSFTQVPAVWVKVYAVVTFVFIEVGLHRPDNDPLVELFGNIVGMGVTP